MNTKVLLFIALLFPFSLMAALPKTIDPNRVIEISKMLTQKPQGVGIKYQDRVFWESLANDAKLKELMAEIPALLKNGMPPFVDSLYLDFSKTGDKIPGERMLSIRNEYLFKLVMAECYENKNNYTAEIEKTMISLCEQNPWTPPTHDRNLETYRGKAYFVDLLTATFGNGLAQSIYLLDDKLSHEVKKIVMNALEQKVFGPIKNCLKTEKLFPWFTQTLNWNSVCIAGVVGAATAVLPSREDRAFYIAFAEQYHTYGLEGYGADGYCSEGVNYFSYGFNALITLRETVCRATSGKIDFFETPKLFIISQYPNKIQIMNNVCPAYSDCSVNASPSWFVSNYCSNALGLDTYREVVTFPEWYNFSLRLLAFFPNQAWPLKPGKYKIEDNTLRSFFNVSGIYVGRPGVKSDCKIGVSAKGGNNAENHNHNDVGSYTVAVGKQTLSGDQGCPSSYPKDYWADYCYDKYKIKGSYGHPVPYINGKTQREGKLAHGEVKQTNFTDKKDVFTIDISSAYTDSTLKKLERSFVYDRTANGSFTVADNFEFSKEGEFETAITTRAKWTKISHVKYQLVVGGERVVVEIEASAPFELTSSTVNDNAPEYERIAIKLLKKQLKGFVNVKYAIE